MQRTTNRTTLVLLATSLLFILGGCADTMGTAKKKSPESAETDNAAETSESDNNEPAVEKEELEETRKKFRRKIEDLQSEFGNDEKEDFLGLKGPCDILEPMYDNEDAVINSKMGWFLELTGHANVLPKSWEGGGAIVADFYHHQMKIGYFRGDGFTLNGGVGASASAHVGLMFGFENNVMDYAGHFASGEVSFSLPGVKEFFEGYVGLFGKGEDVNGDGVYRPHEEDIIYEPPKGVYGGYVGIEGGVNFDPLFGAIPAEPSVSRSKHMLHKGLTKHVYNALDGKVFRLLRIDANLVTKKGNPCPTDWPESKGDKKCFIEFGNPWESHVTRSVKTGGAVCAITGGCANPVAWSAAAQSIAVGAIRETGEGVEEYCSSSDSWF